MGSTAAETAAARKLLAHGLLDEPVPQHNVDNLGDGFAHFGEPTAPAAGASGRRQQDHPLPRWPNGSM